jgi:putative selenate reductase
MVADVIPSFRISNAQTSLDLERIIGSGVKIEYGVNVDEQLFNTIYESGSYIYIATGASVTKKLNLAGENTNGINDPLDFLSQIKQNPYQIAAKNIVIIGGGNTAMDVARTAKRYAALDACVTIAYRRRKHDMPAEPEEIIAALAEGIQLIEMVSPTEILSENGKLTGVKLVRMKASGSFQEKRMLTLPIDGSEFILQADMLFPAIGQEVAITFTDPRQLVTEKGSYATNLSRVFIGGDARKGASNIISAIADGRKAAKELKKAAGISETRLQGFEYNVDIHDLLLKKTKRIHSHLFAQDKMVEQQLPVINSTQDAIQEASRCLLCHKICNVCVQVCPNFANYSYEVPPRSIALQKVEKKGDELIIEFDKNFHVKQTHQIAHLADFCNECGNCNTFCPSNSAPYKEKPHFFLSIKSFNAAQTGYFISKLADRTTIIQKNNGRFTTLTQVKNEYIYETDEVLAHFDSPDFKLKTVEIRVPCVKTAFFENAATLMVLLDGVQHLYSNDIKN